MLLGIDPLIGPELLMVLAAMGHGDEIVLADANFPAVSVARATAHGQALRMDCDAARAVKAVLSLLPVDGYDGDPVLTMQVVGDAQAVPPVVADVAPIFAAQGAAMGTLERFAFYDRARRAFAIVQTAELRPYGNFIIRKGVILR